MLPAGRARRGASKLISSPEASVLEGMDAAAGLEPATSLPIDWNCHVPICVENRGSIRLSYAA
jgi:hypothetical protein